MTLLAELLDARDDGATEREVVAHAVERLHESRRAIDFFRPRELSPPLSRSTIYSLLNNGTLRAVRLEGLTLIEGASLRAWLAQGVPWVPRGRPASGDPSGDLARAARRAAPKPPATRRRAPADRAGGGPA